MPPGSTRRVPAVSSGALYLRSKPRTRSSVAFGTPADGALSGRVAALARAGVTDPRPYRRGTAARLPRKWRRLRLPPPTPSWSSIGALFSVPTVMRCMAASCLVFGRPTPGLRTRWGGSPGHPDSVGSGHLVVADAVVFGRPLHQHAEITGEGVVVIADGRLARPAETATVVGDDPVA